MYRALSNALSRESDGQYTAKRKTSSVSYSYVFCPKIKKSVAKCRYLLLLLLLLLFILTFEYYQRLSMPCVASKSRMVSEN
jgi:hypothetical protein